MWTVGIKEIGLDWLSTELTGFVQAGYYADKLNHRIVLESEMTLEFNSLEDMAAELVQYHEEAHALEESMSINT